MRWLVGLVVAGCYAPTPPLGAPCGEQGACPAGLVCATATRTCELVAGDSPDAPSPDGVADAPRDTPPGPMQATFVEQATSADASGSVTLKIPAPIPTGTLLVLEVAARGAPPIAVTDSRGHSWVKDAEIDNSTQTSVVAIFHVVTEEPMSTMDEVLAKVSASDSKARGVALFRLDGAAELDQVGTAQASGTLSVSTMGALAASPELAFGVAATGFNSPVSFTPLAGFVEVGEFATSLSSGSFNHKTIEDQNGTFQVTSTSNGGNFALAIATYR